MIFTTIDYVFGLIILICAIVALAKGFVDEVFGKAAWVAGIIFSLLFFRQVSGYYAGKINSNILCNILGFITVFVVVFLLIKLAGLIVGKLFELSILKSLDHSLGFIFGILEGFTIVFLIIFILSIQTISDATSLLTESFFFKIYSELIKSPEIQGVTQNV